MHWSRREWFPSDIAPEAAQLSRWSLRGWAAVVTTAATLRGNQLSVIGVDSPITDSPDVLLHPLAGR